MANQVANEHDLYIERGGPFYRLMQRIGLIQGEGPSLIRRIVIFVILIWVPLLAFAFWEGVAIGPTPASSMLYDFATMARIALGVPLLIAAEVAIGPRVRTAGLQFLRAELVRPRDYPRFEAAIARLARWREANWVEVGLFLLAVIGGWTISAESVYGSLQSTWHDVTVQTEGIKRLSYTGLWYHMVAVPIIQFFMARWFWRYLIWIRFLYDVSKLDLDLGPTHADGAAGLAFLGTAQLSFGILAFALAVVLSAAAAFRLVFQDVAIQEFSVHFFSVIITAELFLLGPLIMFSPAMARVRLEWLRTYSTLVLEYNRAFHQKWVVGPRPSEPMLGSADFQSLADLGNGYEYVRSMKIVPFSVRIIVQMALLIIVPAMPLLVLVMPLNQILDLVSKAVL